MTEENMKSDRVNDHNVSNEDSMPIENKQKVFVLYFKGLDRIGVPYGTGELIRKAKELKLPTPSRREIRSWRRKYTK